MILVQLLKVLPAASAFKIYDENRPVLEGQIARYDKSLMFKDVKDDLSFKGYINLFMWSWWIK